ncbi:flagellin [halophilic archaeon]|nr:flagellin [halophilic archaeon]
MNVTQRVDGTEQHTRFEYRVSELGDVDVEKPGWVSEAVERHESDDDSSARVSNRVQIVSAFGNVTENERVDRVTLTVMRAAGSDDVDLSTATVEWIGPEMATTLTHGERASANRFAVEAIKDPDGSVPVLDGQDDRFTVVLDASEIGGALEEGQAAQLKITTESGAVTIYRITVPTSLAGESAVTV